jgi:hypothetical protein
MAVAAPKPAHKIDIAKLDKKVDVISDLLAKLNGEDDFRKLIREWRRPGWTTPAELILVSSALNQMEKQLVNMIDMKADLFRGVEAVGR